jgi:mono/diheme cytochrome c family protein
MLTFVRYYLWIFGIAAAVPIVLAVTLGVRGKQNGNRPIHFFWDMKYQPRYSTQGQSDFFADGRSNRMPVAGTVPFAGGGYAADAGNLNIDSEFAQLALPKNARPGVTLIEYYEGKTGKMFVTKTKVPDPMNKGKEKEITAEEPELVEYLPVVIDKELIRRGQEAYRIHCKVCHGEAGDGMGIIAFYGEQYGVKPASYHQERLRSPTPANVQDYKDGHLFNVITNGKNTMSPYGHQIRVADRWAIVAYMRAMQRSYIATLAEIPEAERSNLKEVK